MASQRIIADRVVVFISLADDLHRWASALRVLESTPECDEIVEVLEALERRCLEKIAAS